ncbi:cathepsin L [Galendromus occidentalis]|uniref:Cathepsin L n=1 Tax=Galendromus occidentalis TaxID=34638 RepID=A0AAJ7WGW0_9ACAR|nr:cathepsin L [Galendromus occidentalis]
MILRLATLVIVLKFTYADWELYKRIHGKSYDVEEESMRRRIFEKNVAMINAHNLLHDLKQVSYRMGLSRLTDATPAEVQALKCLNFTLPNKTSRKSTLGTLQRQDLPEAVDWTQQGYVTPVKDQGKCGACWTFAATGAIEGQHFKATGNLVSLSEQNILDCVKTATSNGCSGGLFVEAFDYLKNSGGIDAEESYPYEASGGTCRFRQDSVAATVSGYQAISAGNEAELQEAVATIGPISVGIDSGHPGFQHYTGGIYYEPECTEHLSHAVLVVGYGTENGEDYWLVKNSWGASYGLQGYIKMARNRNNNCGIATGAAYPITMLCVAALVVLLKFSHADWDLYKRVQNKNYGVAEDSMRRRIFEKNVAMINGHNLLHDLKRVSYRMGLSRFTDSTPEEMRAMRCLNINVSMTTGGPHEEVFDAIESSDLSEAIDWRQQGYVTPVKNQGNCGSCWAFSATGAVEGQHFKATGRLESLSEQNLVDCVKESKGCDGGFFEQAFQYIKDNGGINTEDSYPYEAFDGSCRFREDSIGATVSGYQTIPKGSEADLQKAVSTIGPISVAIDVSNPSFQNYREGVYYEPSCSSSNLDHAVLVVGYGSDGGEDYWLVKNSWGTSFGEQGYVRMARNKGNNCGIASAAAYPTA